MQIYFKRQSFRVSCARLSLSILYAASSFLSFQLSILALNSCSSVRELILSASSSSIDFVGCERVLLIQLHIFSMSEVYVIRAFILSLSFSLQYCSYSLSASSFHCISLMSARRDFCTPAFLVLVSARLSLCVFFGFGAFFEISFATYIHSGVTMVR